MLLVAVWVIPGCAPEQASDGRVVVVFPVSAVGREAEVLERQLDRFERLHPLIRVERQVTPDAADQRHQLFVQWLNARVGDPDVLQLDVIWTAEFAAAGWILPLERFAPQTDDFVAAALEANRWRGALHAMPWFVDVGMLYYRTDLISEPPRTFDQLARAARSAQAPQGLVFQGARYEGLVAVFVEYLGGFGGRILDDAGNVVVDSPAALRALEQMRRSLSPDGYVPRAVLGWQEEPVRFAFQNGNAAFMRNWPYAAPLLDDPERSRVAGRFAVAPMPSAPGGEPTAALGGSQLAINAHSEHPEAAWELIRFLTAPEQMIERARLAGQLPARRSVYRSAELKEALVLPAEDLLAVVHRAEPRPVTPLYTELSQILQVHLHRALTGQAESQAALTEAAAEMRVLLGRLDAPAEPERGRAWAWLLALGAALALAVSLARRRRPSRSENRDARLAWSLVAPALGVIGLVALFPLAWTVWESLHAHDLRMPWRGRPFVGLSNYLELASGTRLWGALLRTLVFTSISVALELMLGLAIALVLERSFRGRGLVRGLALLPWTIPTVVAALAWRFLFEPGGWLTHPQQAWVPLVLADVWKSSPFVALLLLAGLTNIDPRLHEAARLDGANAWQRLVHVTLPLLRPAILVALVFRTLDAFRVFDLVYVLTGGGPGTATEPIALFTFDALMSRLRFGQGAALSVIVFAVAFVLALVYVRLLGRGLGGRA